MVVLKNQLGSEFVGQGTETTTLDNFWFSLNSTLVPVTLLLQQHHNHLFYLLKTNVAGLPELSVFLCNSVGALDEAENDLNKDKLMLNRVGQHLNS